MTKPNFILLLMISSSMLFSQDCDSLLAEKLYSQSGRYFEENKIDSFLSYRIKSKDQYFICENWSKYVDCLNSISNYKFRHGEYIEFQKIQDSIRFVTKNHLNKSDLAYVHTLINLGVGERIRGNYEQAISYGLEAVTSSVTIEVNRKALAYAQLSSAYYRIGNFPRAEQSAQAAVDLLESTLGKQHKKRLIGECYYPLALSQLKLGKEELALENFKKAANLFEEDSNLSFVLRQRIKSWLHICSIYLEREENLQFEHFQKLIENSILKTFKNEYADYLRLIAKKELKASEPNYVIIVANLNEAIKLYEAYFISNSGKRKISQNYFLLADTYLKKKEFEKAKEETIKALEILGASEDICDPEIISEKIHSIKGLHKKLICSNLLGEVGQESTNTIQSIRVLLNSLKKENRSSDQILFWTKENRSIINDCVDHLNSIKRYDLALELIEENKSNLLLNSIKSQFAKGYGGIDPTIVFEESKLKADLIYYKHHLRKSEFNKKDVGELKQRILLAESELTNLLDEIETSYPDYYSMKYSSSEFSLSKIQRELSSDQAMIQYFVQDEKLLSYSITKDKINLVEKKFGQAEKKTIKDFYANCSSRTVENEQEESVSKSAFNLLLTGVFEKINDRISTLIIVPDDILNNLNFGMLQNSKHEYLDISYNLTHQYSATLWQELKGRTSVKKEYDFAGYAYSNESLKFLAERSCNEVTPANLLCSKQEINSIKSTLTNRDVYEKGLYDEHILDLGNKSSILHLATHACADPLNSDLSKIYFDNEEMTSAEVELKRIECDLIVLSACESGYGKVYKGEGTMSLAKSFFHAGAKSAVVSLWSVDDCTTAELMGYFYKYLNEGQEKHVALSNAKKSYLEHTHPNTAKPYYWAGFVLIGDESALWEKTGYSLKIFIPLFLVSFLLIFLFAGSKKT